MKDWGGVTGVCFIKFWTKKEILRTNLNLKQVSKKKELNLNRNPGLVGADQVQHQEVSRGVPARKNVKETERLEKIDILMTNTENKAKKVIEVVVMIDKKKGIL